MKMKSCTAIMALFSVFMVAGCLGDEALQLSDDILGLIVFKTAIDDPFMHLDSWSEDDTSPCAWNFITCNQANSRVTQILLNGLNLSGKIGRGLEKLQFLKVLSLSSNNLTGSLNPELARINGLERLNLSQNSLSGNIPPSLANMSSLQFLDLSMNSLSGPVPDNLFENCFSLRFVSLSGNLLEGPIPSTLTKCTRLNHLNISNNRFSGNPSFSPGIWSLTRLRTLALSMNQLSGPVPYGISVLHNLKELFLHGNQLTGSLPADIGFCPHLSRLDFSFNRFSGEIPWSLQRLKVLNFLSLSNNLFTGDFPLWISNVNSLEYIDFSENAITGSLPMSMGDLKSLKFLSLSNNKLTGNIPKSLVYCSSLSIIRLMGNSFNGSIPEGLFDMGLKEMDFSRNQITGSIPPASRRLFESLQVLDLSANNLIGEIPAEMGLLSRLSYLNLSWNYLGSRMPPEFGYFQNLTVLDLRNSGLFGSIPGDICDSGSLAILQLDGNLLTGPISEEIGNCSSLNLLSLSHNNLSGSIPKSISLLKKLEILKLEVNRLSGEIPQELGKLENLLIVNVSYNRLVGQLPAGSIFPNLDESAIEGNLGICSPLLKGPCKLDVPKPLVLDPYAYGNQIGDQNRRNRHSESTNDGFTHHRFLSVSAIVAISASLVIVLGVILISLLNASARRRIAFVDNALESMCSTSTRSGSVAAGKLTLFDTKSSPDWISTSLDTILHKASEIGSGLFGTVYKASLGGDERRIVAIKKLVTANILQHQEEFDREVQVLGKVRHPNLIPLRGYYWTPQTQLLISDYALEGSLQFRLHERPPTSPPLSWSIRFKIVLGAAKGLAHLHHSSCPPIVHYNVKPSNILLDENLNPKLSDFGLARLVTKLDKHVLSNRFQSAPGYVAPELACQSLRVNEKCDVYGFGVLILELVTGRRPVEYGEDNVMILADHVRALLEQGNARDCVDPSMGKYPEDEVLPVLKLALVCTSQIPSSRPSMAEVVKILQVINTPVPQRIEGF
ncbi:probably inactive leucine-rich repeat receptor-like protein kinase At3g28040 [Olea europaea var. sylvestris]|uniref:probably inactive leucine-rich repeat receptor-like protein kinase At3g28040 n=1 Tax=Olea europaea var. sylvestris TaxID=158386 RepID=UPI000C1CDABF|nr:probably inactive leucine-rich repeat receptor-like protein kinase At3g28040 [Olea europaea var. sylvestris]XP_022855314.1 probably inactive leucine-rich repeat receptor-like protein kinase At3g28040 [Olea europaea var. sylvestris]